MLWHGTGTTAPKVIYEEGFDTRFSARDGKWGEATYFAKNASYSDGSYRYNIDGQRQLICAEVLLGDYLEYPMDGTLRLPPFKPQTNNRYDSVKGVSGPSDVYMVYENYRAYPRYLVTYKV